MEQKINAHLEIINNSIEWVKETDSMKGVKGNNTHRQLVNFRRKLKLKKFALEGNPAIAMYGESQVGKSYLVSSLLSETGNPFSITDEKNIAHNFIEEINPPGGGSESTSLICRFSTSYKPEFPKFPIKAELLSPSDIVLVLCDSFYSDIKPVHELSLSTEEINYSIDSIKQKLVGKDVQHKYIEEDDLLNMQDYFKDYLPKANSVLNSNFFLEISQVIANAKPDEWKDIFSLLWYKDEKFTTLFETLISAYSRLSFANVVYMPIESVLYKHGTLLDVKRLKEISLMPDKIESDYKADTIVFCQGYEILFSKSFLCALTSELVFSQPVSLIENKSFLSKTDLLDFPGARSRLTLPQNLIETKILPELLLRGKVAYLFNRYSDAEKINVLLFCTKHEDAAQRAMPEMLNNWVNKIVGATPEKRESFLSKSEIAPLFIISTFFNVNLQFNPLQDKPGDNSSLNYRWSQRFERTLAQQMLNVEIYNWFENWTVSKAKFQNIFLLRDFEKSDSISHIFRGYNEHKKELEEIIPSQYPDFKEKLRQSFLDYGFVKKHFENPIESWDKAATINQDGSLLIINKLNIAANSISPARLEKTIIELNEIKQEIALELKKHFHDSNSDAQLLKAKSTAGSIQAKLDIAFGKNPYYFGMMMKELMLNNSNVYKLFLERIQDIERRDVVNLDKYSAIRMRIPELSPKDSFESNLERLKSKYEKQSLKECQEFFENEEGIDLNELFYGNSDRVKNFSQVLADALEAYWFEKHLTESKHNLSPIFSDTGLQDIQEMLRTLFRKLQISKFIAASIRHYVDGYHNIEDAYEMIADISTEIINKFINSIGLDFFSESDLADLKQANEKNSLGIELEHKDLQYNKNTSEEVADIITDMSYLPELLNQNPLPVKAKRLPNYRSYIIWSDLLKVGFVSVCDIPNYDVQANNKLKSIIEQCETIKY